MPEVSKRHLKHEGLTHPMRNEPITLSFTSTSLHPRGVWYGNTCSRQPALLAHVAETHKQEMKVLDRKASSTIALFGTAYSVFDKFLQAKLGDVVYVTDMTSENARLFFMEHVAISADKSYRTYRSLLGRIASWLMKREHIPWAVNPIDDIPVRKSHTLTTRDRRLDDKEFARLIKAAARSHPRDYYLCWFQRLGERRINETLALVWGDVRWEDGDVIYDNTKAHRFGQKMPLTPELRALLTEWKEEYARDLGYSVTNKMVIFPALYASGPIKKGRKRDRTIVPESKISNPARLSRELLGAAGLYQESGDGWHILRKTSVNAVKQTASNAGRADAWEMAKLSADHGSENITRVYVNSAEDYERYKEFRMKHSTISDDLALQTSFLAPLVRDRQVSDQPVSVETGSNVIDFGSRRQVRMVT